MAGLGDVGTNRIIDEQIHPCKGCEDYVPENGCKSNGSCGAQAKLKDLIMEVFNMRPSTAEKCIAILDDIKAIIENEEMKRGERDD